MDLIQQWCVEHAEKTALVTPTNAYTWQQLDEEISQLSLQLTAQGVSCGHIIAVISKNEPEAVFFVLGCVKDWRFMCFNATSADGGDKTKAQYHSSQICLGV